MTGRAQLQDAFVCLVGASGCGKSTMLNLIADLDRPTAGTVEVQGRATLMFQEAALFPWLTAIENVAWPLEMKKLPKRERLAKAAEYLDLVHLSRFADLYLGQMSGGMKQRVALARLFALDPDAVDAVTRPEGLA